MPSVVNTLRQRRREEFVASLAETQRTEPPPSSIINVTIDKNGPFFVFPTSGYVSDLYACATTDCVLTLEACALDARGRERKSSVAIPLKQGVSTAVNFDIYGYRGTVCSATISSGYCIATFRFTEETVDGPAIVENTVNENSGDVRTTLATRTVPNTTTSPELPVPNDGSWVEGDTVGTDAVLDGIAEFVGELDQPSTRQESGE